MVQKSNHNLNISRPGRLKKKRKKPLSKSFRVRLVRRRDGGRESDGGKGEEGEGKSLVWLKGGEEGREGWKEELCSWAHKSGSFH